MESLATLFYRSALVRLTLRGAVFTVAAFALIRMALKLESYVSVLSTPAAFVAMSALVLVEATLLLAMKLLFRRVQ